MELPSRSTINGTGEPGGVSPRILRRLDNLRISSESRGLRHRARLFNSISREGLGAEHLPDAAESAATCGLPRPDRGLRQSTPGGLHRPRPA